MGEVADNSNVGKEWVTVALRVRVPKEIKTYMLKNVPLGDETKDFLAKWGNVAKDAAVDVKEKNENS